MAYPPGVAPPQYHAGGALNNLLYDRPVAAAAAAAGAAIKTGLDYAGTFTTARDIANGAVDWLEDVTGVELPGGSRPDAEERMRDVFFSNVIPHERDQAFKEGYAAARKDSASAESAPKLVAPSGTVTMGWKPKSRKRRRLPPVVRASAWKYFDFTYDYTPDLMLARAYQMPVFLCMNCIMLGAGGSARLGDCVRIMSITTNLWLAMEGVALHVPPVQQTPPSHVRAIMFVDRQSNGYDMNTGTTTSECPGAAMLLKEPTSVQVGTWPNYIYAFTNLENAKRFKILYDVVIPMMYALGSRHLMRKYLTLQRNPVEVVYKGDDNDVAEIATGALWMMIMCTSDSAVTFMVNNRIRYVG